MKNHKFMSYSLLVFAMSIIPISAYCKGVQLKHRTLVVAVLDSGIDGLAIKSLCSVGHRSFVDGSNDPLNDPIGHGTHIAGLIEKFAGHTYEGRFCLISVKWWAPNMSNHETHVSLLAALRYAIDIKADIINFSAGGPTYNVNEFNLVEEALDSGITIINAAGNNGSDLDYLCNWYPTCYDNRVIAVGNLDTDGVSPNKMSSYGNKRVQVWEMGTNVLSRLPGLNVMGRNSGTSQAAGIATGKLVHVMLH